MTEKKPGELLGIEGGGTRTTVIAAAKADGELLETARRTLGPGNLRLLDDAQLEALFTEAADLAPCPTGIGIGMAGARGDIENIRIRTIAGKVWPDTPLVATHDLETAWQSAGPVRGRMHGRLTLISGTGSVCYGKCVDHWEDPVRTGGWGHILGDGGSGYGIALEALRGVVSRYDERNEWPRLGEVLLRSLQMNHPDELVEWIGTVPKAEIAALASEIFAAREGGCESSREIAEMVLGEACAALETLVRGTARKLGLDGRSPFELLLRGSVIERQSDFAANLVARLKRDFPRLDLLRPARDTAWGAVMLAWEAAREARVPVAKVADKPEDRKPMSLAKSPTEQRNPASTKLDTMTPLEAVEMMLAEDAKIPPALLRHKEEIARVVEWITGSFRQGGRLFYAGAGTSGRLGVLDASECPPTFRADPEQVQGIIAGGQKAIWQAVEGAEDSPAAGAGAVETRGVRAGDVVVGIAASGRTPFVWGALAKAREVGARTVMLCFNPHVDVPEGQAPDQLIAVDLGPEVLTGSTRLKSGTATKLVLNIFTTLAMVGIGKVVSNLMVDLNPSNVKLRDRAARIVAELTGKSYSEALDLLETNGWVVKRALEAAQ